MTQPACAKSIFYRRNPKPADPSPETLPFDRLWNRWLNSIPGSPEAVELADEVARRHGSATADLREGEIDRSDDDE